jgi:two-component system sensor histidine kinase CiaH
VTRSPGARLSPVGPLAVRVALLSTAIVTVLYVVTAGVSFLVLQRNLSDVADNQLRDFLALLKSQPASSIAAPQAPPGADHIAPRTLSWTTHPDGTVTTGSGIALPDGYRHTEGPATIVINGSEFRAAGEWVGQDYLVVGLSLGGGEQATEQLLRTEVIVGAGLLLVVFVGAYLIGRRVGVPLERARQRQLEFTADASHELRTPLSVIQATTGLALTRERDPAWYRSAISRIDAESRRMRGMVEDMLWLARFDSSLGQPNAEPIDLGMLADQAADRFAGLAEARGISLLVECDPELAFVAVPADWLDRVLGVLLDNACKYVNERGTVRVSVEAEGNHVSVVVDDSGPGIPPEERERIFDRFHRATERKNGTGLGLAIADAVVRATHGRWQVGASELGGASMRVTWPRRMVVRAPRERASAPEVIRALALHHQPPRLSLVLKDDSGNRSPG